MVVAPWADGPNMLRGMAELDYAYLADYAQIENGKISALGASYTHAVIETLPATWMTSIVGRVRSSEDEGPVVLRIEVNPPSDGYKMRFEGEVPKTSDMRPYRGKVGLLFTVTAQIPMAETGLYTFDVFVNDEHARRLAFEVEVDEKS